MSLFRSAAIQIRKSGAWMKHEDEVRCSNRPRSICFEAQGGNYTKSRPGGRWVELWRQPRVSLILFFLVTFRYFVSEMVLTCAVSIYIICKYGNGEIFTQSEEENGSRHL